MNIQTISRPELLAPAGNALALKAAVENGADAVYLGLQGFNARRSAANFSPEGLKDAVDYAHLREVKVYLAFNILVAAAELETAAKLLVESYNAGIDGLIIQDWGIYELARELVPGLPLHASTQMNTHNSAQARFLEEKGFQRIVLARELSLAEIADIRTRTALELETFVHGARCFSYSGQCLFSSMVGGRSGNRGLCTQPCRLPYELVTLGRPISKKPVQGQYILSTKDLCAVGLIPKLVKAGIGSFKIEGRLKSPEYVAIVTRVYRQAIDRYLQDPEHFQVLEEELTDLKEAFYRGFTEGFMSGQRGSELMNYQRSSHRGLMIGRVSAIDVYSGLATMLLQQELHVGDELEFWISKGGRLSQKVKTIWTEGREVPVAGKGDQAAVLVSQKRHLLKTGDRVFRTCNWKLQQEARESLRPGRFLRKVPVSLRLDLKTGKPARLEAAAGTGEKAVIQSDFLIERSEKKGLSEDQVKERFGRMTGTTYVVADWQIEMDKDIMIAQSKINELRNRLLESLSEQRLLRWERRPVKDAKDITGRFLVKAVSAKQGHPRTELVVEVAGFDQLKAAVVTGADWVYLCLGGCDPARDDDMLDEIIRSSKYCRQQQCRFALSTPNILKESELKAAVDVISKTTEHLDAVVAGNTGLAYVVRAEKPVILDYQLNIYEPLAYQPLADLRPLRVTLSPELNQEQIGMLVEGLPVPAEVLVHGPLEVLVAEHCIPLASTDRCQKVCRDQDWAIRDAKGFVFPVELDSQCRSHLFNSKGLCLLDELVSLVELKVGAVRLMLKNFSAPEVKAITGVYRQALDRIAEGRADLGKIAGEAAKASPSFNGYTRGHFHRGVQ